MFSKKGVGKDSIRELKHRVLVRANYSVEDLICA